MTWSDRDTDLLRHLVRCQLSANEIADAFAIIGCMTNENTIQRKATALGLRFTAHDTGRFQGANR